MRKKGSVFQSDYEVSAKISRPVRALSLILGALEKAAA